MTSNWHRRGFLGGGLSALLTSLLVKPASVLGSQGQDPEARIKELGLSLPGAATPVATYRPAVQVGNTLYVSGSGPGQGEDGEPIRGKVGKDLTLEQANAAARLVGIRVLGTVRETLGSLNKVVRVVKVLGMVNAVPDFTQQPQVINGFSDLLVEVFGEERGKGARSAVGMGSLPGNIPVEIESIFEVSD